jgi:hypothetical protein
MNPGNLIYVIFPLYFVLLYLTIDERFQYITMPLIAFINILAVLWLMVGSMGSSDLLIMAINAALIVFTIYIFTNSTISWILSLLYIGATSIGVAKPNESFNLNAVIMSMLILSVAIIIGTVSVGKTRTLASTSLDEKVILPRSYQNMFDELKSAMVVCFTVSLIVLGLNITVVSGIENNPSQPEVDTPTNALADSVKSSLTTFSFMGTTLLWILNMIFTPIRWSFNMILKGISYAIKSIFQLILAPIILIVGFFGDATKITDFVDTIKNVLSSFILYVKTSFIDVAAAVIGFIVLGITHLTSLISSIIGTVVGAPYTKIKSAYNVVKPRSTSNFLILAAVAALSSVNMYFAFSQLYNGFELLRLPNMLNTN